MFDACPVHPKGTMVIPMLWRIFGYVVCMLGVKNENHHTHPYCLRFYCQKGEGAIGEEPRFRIIRSEKGWECSEVADTSVI